VSLTITSLVVSASRGLVDALPGGLALVLDGVQFGLLLAATAGLYHYVPHTDVRWRHALAGALFVAVAFELAKGGLAWYVESVPVYSTVYGALATLPILLLWIYVVWVIVLLGAIIAAYAPSLQMRVVRRPPHPGWRFELALEVLQALRDAREGRLRGVSLSGLAASLRTDPLQLEPLVDLLVALDWVARLDEAGAMTDGPRLMLLCDPARTSLGPLLDRTLLAPGPAAAAFNRRAALDRLTLQDALSD
jgi:membrane protein